MKFTTIMFCLMLASLGCAANQPIKMNTNTIGTYSGKLPDVSNQNQKGKDSQIENLKSVTSEIPKVASVTEGISKIDFLKDTYLLPAETSTQKKQTLNTLVADQINVTDKVYLGKKNGRDIYYLKNTGVFSKFSASVKENTAVQNDQIITYNHRRDLLGIFNGSINIVAKTPQYVQELPNKYPVTIQLYTGVYCTVKLKSTSLVEQVFKSLSSDTNIESVQLVIKEDEIVLH